MPASWLGDVNLENSLLEMRNYKFKSHKNEISPFHVAGGNNNLLHQTEIGDTPSSPLNITSLCPDCESSNCWRSVAPPLSGNQLSHSCFTTKQNTPSSKLTLHQMKHKAQQKTKNALKKLLEFGKTKPVLIFPIPTPTPMCTKFCT